MLDSPEPFSPVNLAWLLYRQSHRWLCKDVMHDGNQILPIERLGQKGGRSRGLIPWLSNSLSGFPDIRMMWRPLRIVLARTARS